MVDVNGTRFHLTLGQADWDTYQSPPQFPDWEYDSGRESVNLRAEPFQFPDYFTTTPMSPDVRRGAGADRYGNQYWISQDHRSVLVRWSLAQTPEHYWSASDDNNCDDDESLIEPELFQPKEASATPDSEPLSGLAVTNEHYLVIGSPTRAELIVFDLHTGGAPIRIALHAPSGENLTDAPHRFDITPMPDGGIVLLDRRQRSIWIYDQSLHSVPYASPAPISAMFQPKAGDERQVVPNAEPEPLILPPEVIRPVAVEPVPGCGLLVLDTPLVGFGDANAHSTIHFFPNGTASPSSSNDLAFDTKTDAFDVDIHILAHDLAMIGASKPESESLTSRCDQFADAGCAGSDYVGTVYVVRHDGNQAFALSMCVNPTDQAVCYDLRPDYYPLRHFGGRALITAPGDSSVYFDHQADDHDVHWLPLTNLPIRRYAQYAELISEPFDGSELACVWHRLCIDACIPPETKVSVFTRAADERDLVALQLWQQEPPPYLRGHGAEIPYYSLWSRREQESESTGTWELLFQQAFGQYLQIKLVLEGNRRATPRIRAVRAHYPRFSYLRAYLPDVYQRDETSAHFMERLLANTEGLFTVLEGLIAQAQVYFDSRSVPRDVVEWLAAWVGLAFDSTWTDHQRRLLLDHALYFFSRRGTRLGIVQLLWVALDPGAGERIFMDNEDPRCAPVRLIELYETTDYSLEMLGGTIEESTTIDSDDLAHRFVVLVDAEIADDRLGMVERLVNLQKPAHAAFSVRRFWNMFRVGSSRLGFDTVLDQSARFVPLMLGKTGLGEGVLGTSYPDDVVNRIVIRK